jgi:hypothetical protein
LDPQWIGWKGPVIGPIFGHFLFQSRQNALWLTDRSG